jgi:hypothetical protein
MSLLNRKSNLDLVGQFAKPEIQDSLTSQVLSPDGVQQDEMVGHFNNIAPSMFALGPEPSIQPNQIDTLHERNLESVYTSQTNPLAKYGAGQPGGTWPSLFPSNLDISGNPAGNDILSQYIDNLPK